jgi:hypothetical protein
MSSSDSRIYICVFDLRAFKPIKSKPIFSESEVYSLLIYDESAYVSGSNYLSIDLLAHSLTRTLPSKARNEIMNRI